MTAPIHTIPRDLVDGLLTGNETTLEHGFRELFPTLAHEAAEELQDSSSAGRVVERAFLRVLNEKSAITNSDSLDVALQRAMHDCVVREKSRRAALHRFEHNEGVQARKSPRIAVTSAETDQAWGRIQKARHPEASPSAEALTSATAAKHRAAVHVADAMGQRSKWTIPAIVLGLIAVCGGAYGLSRIEIKPGEQDITRALMSMDAQTLAAGNGQIGSVSLADESQVKLGAGSHLRVSKDFGQAMRVIGLNGTAAFTVAPAKPAFELRVNGVALSLASGRLDVSGDSLGPTLVRVIAGPVQVTARDSAWTATAGQVFLVETTGKVRAPVALEIVESLGWLDRRFAATGSVSDAVAKINRWYGADVGIGDASIADRPVEVTGSLDSLSSTIKALERSARAHMQWSKAGQMVLYRAFE
jgi:ferric-dicitrate binding protein FerR (iron transport regulator)